MSRTDEIRARVAAADTAPRYCGEMTSFDLELLDHAPADLAYLLDRVAELETLARQLRDTWDQHGGHRMPDWACRLCRPNSEMLVDGFVCAYHQVGLIGGTP